MTFSERLKELRLQKGLSQEKLSRQLDMVTRTYIYYETGKRYPSVELLNRMAKFFDVSISYLMCEPDEAQAQEGNRKNPGAKQLIREISSLFENSELSETEKEAVMEALQEAYRIAKKKNQQA